MNYQYYLITNPIQYQILIVYENRLVGQWDSTYGWSEVIEQHFNYQNGFVVGNSSIPITRDQAIFYTSILKPQTNEKESI